MTLKGGVVGHLLNGDASGTLTPEVYSFTAPSLNASIELPSAANSSVPPIRSSQAMADRQRNKANASQHAPTKKPKRIHLNKYGMAQSYATAYPTPLGKYIEMAEDQRLKLQLFEKKILRMKAYQPRKTEPLLSDTGDSQRNMVAAADRLKSLIQSSQLSQIVTQDPSGAIILKLSAKD